MISRALIGGLVSAALAACAPAVKTDAVAAADNSCAQAASREIAILGDTPDYLVEARSFEAPMPLAADRAEMAKSNPCASATVVLTFRRKDDAAFVHGYATSMNRMDLIEGHAGPAFDSARLKAFLEGWTSAIVSTTDLASAKSETVITHLDAAAYDAVKTAKRPMVCHETSVHETACYVVAPDNAYVFEPFYSEDHS